MPYFVIDFELNGSLHEVKLAKHETIEIRLIDNDNIILDKKTLVKSIRNKIIFA